MPGRRSKVKSCFLPTGTEGSLPELRLLDGSERRERSKDALAEAWEASGRESGDFGIREAYVSLPRAPIRLIVCPVNKAINQGGLLRLAEAFRLESVDFEPEPDGAIDMSGSRGTRDRQPWRWISAEQAVREAKDSGYFVVAVTLSERTIDVDQLDWQFPLALVLGSEKDGIPDDLESMCHASVAIPLYGLVQSLNITSAASIVVDRAHRAYVKSNPEFLPARSTSRRLLGHPPADYSAPTESKT